MQKKLLSAGALAAAILMYAATAHAAPKAVTDGFKRLFPEATVASVREAVPGIYEIVSDGEVFYVTADGRHLFAGSILDTVRGRNLTEVTRKDLRRAALAQVSDRTVVYAPENYRHTVSVFTDVDCGWCRKFHTHMPELHRLGIRVNYLLTPFRGEEAYAKAVGVWCARDRNAALDRAKRGRKIPLKQCDNPIEDHLRLAQIVGMQGTPGILLESGTFLRGYLPPDKLLQALEQDALEGGAF